MIADASKRFGAVALLLAAWAATADAQERKIPEEAEVPESSVRMRETEILGEQEVPDVLFILPESLGPTAGKRVRKDYDADIRRPAVEPWMARDAALVARDPGAVNRTFSTPFRSRNLPE